MPFIQFSFHLMKSAKGYSWASSQESIRQRHWQRCWKKPGRPTISDCGVCGFGMKLPITFFSDLYCITLGRRRHDMPQECLEAQSLTWAGKSRMRACPYFSAARLPLVMYGFKPTELSNTRCLASSARGQKEWHAKQ